MKKATHIARKALSVFLSLLMILTTWTVAVPGLVLAADGNKYYVKVYVNIYDGSDGYAGAYSVDTATGKPANYSWATNDGWYGRINMTGFTVFGEGGDYDAQDVSAALLEAENLGTYYAMSGLSDNNANGDWDSKAIAKAEYTFTLDSFPVEIFWMNDENNWDGGNTGFAIRKLTVATSEGGTEHTMWEGLAGSDSETYNYYGSITPTGIHTCFEDYAKNYDMDDYKFYKAITTSSQRAWADPYSAGSYGTYYLNDYASGGVSATFSEGVESIAYNVDYINTGSTDTYHMNFINHSETQSATIVGVNNSDKFVSNPAGTVLAPGANQSFELKNISSLGGDGGVANFCFNYTLDNVYASDALDASLAQFYQPCYIGTWNASDDSKQISDENGDGNTGFSLYKADNYTWGDNSMTIINTFQTTEGILERNSATSGDGTDNATFNYNYYIDTTGITNWNQTGLRFHVKESQYYTLSFQPADYTAECGTITMGGTFANPNEASITIADIAYSSVTEDFQYNHDQASGFYTYADYYTTGTPMWNVTQADNNASFYNNSEGWFRFAGNMIKGSGNSAATINFSNMTYRDRQNGSKVYFSGTINVYAFDKTALRDYVRETLIDFAPMSLRYDSTAFATTYQEKLSNAMRVLAKQKTSQSEIDTALAELKSAVEALQTNANLVNQIDELTHIQYVDGIGSEIANQTAKRYVLIPLGEHTVPEKAEYIGNGTFRNVTNKKSNLVTNYTKDDTEIDYLNYYYWNIDYSQVNSTIELVDNALENFDSDTYSSTLKTALENAKEQLEAIDQTTTGDNTPTSQEDVDNVIKAATDLLAHMDEGYEHCDYDANDDGENELKTKDSTCSEAGYTYYKCNICGKVQKVEDLELAEHSWDAGTETTAPECGNAGVITYTCLVCGVTKTEPTTEIGTHDFQISDNGDGTHISKCSKCGANEDGATAEAHTYNYTNNADGTHTATCSVCNATVTADHVFTKSVLTRPTLVDGVWTDGYYTRTCVCGATKTEPAQRADYTELENAVAELEELNNNENLTDDAKAEIAEALEKAEDLADDLVTAEQSQINDLVEELKDVKADVEKAIEESKTTSPITEATSGIGVQFLKKTGVDTVESVQLASAGGFETVRMRLSNHNRDLPITVTKVTADKAYIGADDTAASAVFDTATVIDEAGSTDLYIVAPADFKEAGNITYTINYMVGNDADGYLKDADGNPIIFTTKAYLYVKAAAFTPYHLMDERAAWPRTATSKWQHYVEATNYGDFGLVSNTSASKFNDNLESGTSWISLGYAHTTYDYDEDCCQAGCTDGNYTTGDGHVATYRYYVDTSLAPTWEAAGFRVRVTESAESIYENAPLKYMRVATDQAFLDGISGDDKTFTVTFVPSSTSNVPEKRWSVTSTGTLEVGAMSNPNEDEYLFGEHKNNDEFDETSAYANFTGTIPAGVTDAKFMFSPRIEFNGAYSAESVTMTSHIWLTSYDKAELREAVSNAENAGYNPGYFDADKYAAYENALADAKEVLGKAETNQTEVDEATAALNNAIADLTASGNEAKFVLTVTHSIHENADKNSEATATEYDYYLVNGNVTPALNNAAIALEKINKYDSVVTLNVTADSAHTYNYWYIDYSGVQDAIDAADAIINDTTSGYSDEYKAQVEEAKTALEEINKTNSEDSTTAPVSQDDVDNAIGAVTDLTGHTCNEAVEIPAEAPTCEDDGLTAGAKCSVCGKITKAQEVDPATNHNYDIANAVLIARPELVDGEWTTGKYEATCLNDESHKLPLEGVQRADYTAFDEAVAKLKELATYENFTDAIKAEILNMATQLENGTYDHDGDGTPNVPLNYVADYTYNGVTIPGEQVTLNAIVVDIEGLVADIESNKTNENFIKPDFTDALVEWEEYLSLVEQYGGEVAYGTEGDSTTATVTDDGYIKDATNTEVTNGFSYLLENAYNSESATAAAWKDTIADMTATLAAINEGIIDGTLRDPNFEAYDEEVKTYNEETSKVNVSDDDKAAVEAAMATVDAIKANPDATAKDSDATIADQTAIIKDINDKYAVCVEGTHDYADATCTEAKTCMLCGATEGTANGHKWGTEPSSKTLPVYDEETATWSQGEFTYECENCTETVTIYADRADYSEYDALVKAYDDIVNDESLWASLTDETIEALSEYKAKLDSIALDYTKATTDAETGITTPDGQAELDALLEGLDVEIEKIQKSIEDGSGRVLDFTEFEEAVTVYEGDPDDGIDATEDIASAEDRENITNLINEIRELYNVVPVPNAASEEQKQIDEATEEIRAIIDKYADCLANGHTWGAWAEQVDLDADGNFEKATYTRTCEKCGKIESYEAERENYDAYDDAVAKAEELLTNEDLTDAAKETIQNALDEAEALDQNLPADIVTTDDEGNEVVIDVNNNAETIEDTTNALNGVINSLYDENGELKDEFKKVDYTNYNNAVNAYEAVKDVVPNADQATVEAIKAEIEAIPETGTAAQYQTQVDKAAADIAAITAKYTKCADGDHTWSEGVLTRPVEIDGTWEDGYYTYTCEVCGTTKTEVVKRADYTSYDKAVTDLNNLLANENLTDAAKAEIEKVLADNAINSDHITTEQDIVDDAAAALKVVLDEINNDVTGEYEKVDYTNYNNAVNAYETLKDTMTDADQAAVEAIKEEIAEIPADGSKADYQTQVDKAAADIAAINAKYADCANGNHVWGDPVLTKAPTADANGEYTETCGVCGATQITEVERADYDAFDDVVKTLEDLAKTENLTDVAKSAIEEALEKAEALDKNLPDNATTADGKYIEGGQDKIDALVGELNDVVADVTADITDGSALKPDYSAWEEAETAYDTLDKTNVKPEIIVEADGLKAEIAEKQADDTLTQATATQTDINNATARLNEIIAGIEDGSLRDPDYSKVEDKIDEANANDNLNKDTQDKIKDIEEALEAIKTKTEPEANAKDDQDDVNALEDQLDEILDSIANGTATAPDYTAWDEAEGTYDALDKTNAPAGLVTEATNLKTTIDTLKADDTANAKDDQPTINDATTRLNEIIDAINAVLTEKPDYSGYDGSHDTYEELVEQYGDKIKDGVAEDVADLDAIVDGVRNDETSTKIDDQDTIDDAKTALDTIIAGIEDGSLRDPDYSAVEDKIDEANANDNLNKDTQDKIDEIEKALEEIKTKTEPEANAKDDQDDVDALEDQLDEILDSIENGTATAPDYTEWNAAEGTYDALDKTNAPAGLVTEATELKATVDALKADDTANAKDDQPTINDATTRLNEIIDAINAILTEKPDYSGYDGSHDTYEELVEQYGDKIKDGVADDVAALDAIVDGVRNDETSTKIDDQDTIDDAKTALDTIIAGIEDGSLRDPDYSKVEDKIDEANANDNLNKDTQDKIKDIEEALEEIKTKTEPEANAKDDQDDVDALEDQLDEILKDIADGSAVKPDYSGVDEDLEKAKDKAEGDVSDELKDKIKDIEEELEDLKNDPTTNAKDDQPRVDELEDILEEILTGCKNGNHDFAVTEVGATCTVKAHTIRKCKNCIVVSIEYYGETLPHDYDIDNDGVDDFVLKRPYQNNKGVWMNGTKTYTCEVCHNTMTEQLHRADYDAYDSAVKDLNDLLKNNDLNDAAKAEIAEALNDNALENNLTKEDEQGIVDAAAEALENLYDEIMGDESNFKPDYTNVNKDLSTAKDLVKKNDVVDGVEDQIKAIEDALNLIKKDPTSNKKDDQAKVDALEDALEAIIAGIKDGSLVKPDFSQADAVIDQANDVKDAVNLPEDVKNEINKTIDEINKIKNDPTATKKDDQSKVDSLKDKLFDLVDEYVGCANGNHTDSDSDRICDLCGHEIPKGADGCICHKGNIFSDIVRLICTCLTWLFRTKITCCSDMEFYFDGVDDIT